jgi:predicted Zn-dependent peptidase
MTMRSKSLCLLALLALALASPAAADIPAHPEALEFPSFDFEPPVAAEYRRELTGGVPVYLVPSSEFPLITITFAFKGGAFLVGEEHTGLAGMLGTMMRRGGTTTVSAEDFDERVDFLAANVSTSVGDDSARATVNTLTANLDEAFALFLDMLRNPGFDAERLRIEQDRVIEQLKQRNDSPMSVAQSRMGELLFGPEHFSARQPTLATIEAITPEALAELHGRIFHPGNLIIGVTGDFDEGEILARLSAAVADWPVGPTAGDPPAPDYEHVAGLYHADTDQADLPQGTAILIKRSLQRDDPDAIPMTLMNYILGGGGFTSRVTNRVRSDEGLAYSAGTFMQTSVYYPGVFGGFFQSKNRTVALATKIILEEIDRIRTEPVSDEELELAKNSFIERFPQTFASKPTILSVFVSDEMTRRDPDYWQTYRQRIGGVTPADVQRVAGEYLSPEELIILVVGDWEEIYPGDLEGRASMNDFFDGNVTHLPRRDPLTLEPVEE